MADLLGLPSALVPTGRWRGTPARYGRLFAWSPLQAALEGRCGRVREVRFGTRGARGKADEVALRRFVRYVRAGLLPRARRRWPLLSYKLVDAPVAEVRRIDCPRAVHGDVMWNINLAGNLAERTQHT